MKTITIAKTRSGFVVVSGELEYSEKPKELFDRSDSFNEISKAVTHIRKTLMSWNETEPHLHP